MAYKQFKKGEKAKYLVASKVGARKYILIPYRSMPKNLRGKEYVVDASTKYKLNAHGYAVTTTKPKARQPKRMSRQMYARHKAQRSQIWFGGW